MILEKLRQRAASDLQHIVLPEGEDARTVVAAALCSEQKIARITLLGNEEKIRALAQTHGVRLGSMNGKNSKVTQSGNGLKQEKRKTEKSAR